MDRKILIKKVKKKDTSKRNKVKQGGIKVKKGKVTIKQNMHKRGFSGNEQDQMMMSDGLLNFEEHLNPDDNKNIIDIDK